jgi:hypothetical protein
MDITALMGGMGGGGGYSASASNETKTSVDQGGNTFGDVISGGGKNSFLNSPFGQVGLMVVAGILVWRLTGK